MSRYDQLAYRLNVTLGLLFVTSATACAIAFGMAIADENVPLAQMYGSLTMLIGAYGVFALELCRRNRPRGRR